MCAGVDKTVPLQTAQTSIYNPSLQPTMSLIATHSLRVDAEPSDTRDLDDSFWELELLGIQKTDKSVYEEFCERIRLVDGRYKVSLP